MAAVHRLAGNRVLTLLPVTTIGAAAAGVLGTPVLDLVGMTVAPFQAVFLYGAGGVLVRVYVQTTFDGGLTWVDIAAFLFQDAAATYIHSVRAATAVAAYYTPTDGSLTDETIKDGLLGSALRVKYTSVGTYTGATSLAVYAVTKG